MDLGPTAPLRAAVVVASVVLVSVIVVLPERPHDAYVVAHGEWPIGGVGVMRWMVRIEREVRLHAGLDEAPARGALRRPCRPIFITRAVRTNTFVEVVLRPAGVVAQPIRAMEAANTVWPPQVVLHVKQALLPNARADGVHPLGDAFE